MALRVLSFIHIMRDSCIFYRSFYEAMNGLDSSVKANIYDAIFEYSLNGILIELSGLEKTIFTLIKPQLDANNKRFENGKKGGKPKQNNTETKPKRNQNVTKTEANNNVNDNVNVNNNNNENNNMPTFEEFLTYGKEKEPSVKDTALKNKYDAWVANDWKDGNNNKIKNWKSKLCHTLPYIEKETTKKVAPVGWYYNKDGVLKRIVS